MCTQRTGVAARWASVLWLAPVVLYSADANAWGLYTHMYFSQILIWAVPLLDPRFQRALRRFPELCLAASCLPDVSLFSTVTHAPTLATTHQWSRAVAMLQTDAPDEERAMALGYAAHLLTDIVAHNYFVPAHERRWLRVPVLTHAGAEWAMDAHVGAHLFTRPEALIHRNREALVAYAEQRLGLERSSAARALRCLGTGEKLLRASRLPQLAYASARLADPPVRARFDAYVSETASRLRQINRLIGGETPAWPPEIGGAQEAAIAPEPELPGPYRLLLPPDWFRDPPSHGR